MKNTKKAVCKAAAKREKVKAGKIARKARQSGVFIPSSEEMGKFALVQPEVVANIPPPHLFKYASPERIWDTLDSGLIYFADPRSFNDPCDSRIWYAKNQDDMEKKAREFLASPKYNGGIETEEAREKGVAYARATWDVFVERVSEQLPKQMNQGYYCLSSTYASFPMWAHYAKNHKGGCLVFNLSAYVENAPVGSGVGCFPFSLVRRVEYRDKMPDWDSNASREEIVERHFLTKSKEWEYESEWRALMADSRVSSSRQPSQQERLPPSFRGVGKYPHNGTLLGVILGSKMHRTSRWMMHRKAMERNLAIWQASIKIGEYSLDIEPCNARAQNANLSVNE